MDGQIIMTGFVNVYDDGETRVFHGTKEDADRNACDDREQCIGVHVVRASD